MRSSHLAFTQCVLSASWWWIHTVVFTHLLLERDPVLFYRIDQTSIWSITCMLTSPSVDETLLLRYANIPFSWWDSVVEVCELSFQLMRHCCRGMRTTLSVDETQRSRYVNFPFSWWDTADKVCEHPFQLMRHCSRGIWTSLSVDVRLLSRYVNFPFSWWDTAVEVCELPFQLMRHCWQGMWTSFSEREVHIVDEILLSRYVNLSTNFRGLPFKVEMVLICLQHMCFVLFAFTWTLMPPAACFRQYWRDSAWLGVFARSVISYT